VARTAPSGSRVIPWERNGPMSPSKPYMKVRTSLKARVAAAVAAALLGGCAKATPAGSAGSLGSTVRVSYSDVGRTVDLVVGDTLVVNLSQTGSQLRWRLSRYPTGVLRPVTPAGGRGTFRFEVTGTGSGEVLIMDTLSCAGGPAAGSASRACPYAAGGTTSSPAAGANLAIRPFSLTVRVT